VRTFDVIDWHQLPMSSHVCFFCCVIYKFPKALESMKYYVGGLSYRERWISTVVSCYRLDRGGKGGERRVCIVYSSIVSLVSLSRERELLTRNAGSLDRESVQSTANTYTSRYSLISQCWFYYVHSLPLYVYCPQTYQIPAAQPLCLETPRPVDAR
jgi:hypothetical protein